MNKNKKNKFTLTHEFKEIIGLRGIDCITKTKQFKNTNPDILSDVYMHTGSENINIQGNGTNWSILYPPTTIWGKSLIYESGMLLNAMLKVINSHINVDNSYYIVRRKKEFDPQFVNKIEKTKNWCWIKAMLKNHQIIEKEEEILYFNEKLYKAILLGREIDKIEKEKRFLIGEINLNNCKENIRKI